jgi:hypothetical protein
MLDVTASAEPTIDIWSYVDAVPFADLEGHRLTEGQVSYVYEHPRGTFLHVLVDTASSNVFLAIIIDLTIKQIYGHYLLDLNRLYSVESDPE